MELSGRFCGTRKQLTAPHDVVVSFTQLTSIPLGSLIHNISDNTSHMFFAPYPGR
jgi:hypothetical protein